VNKKLEEVLTNKNSIIRALQYDVAKVSKAHNDLIRVYEAKLAEYGIPAGELCGMPCQRPAAAVASLGWTLNACWGLLSGSYSGMRG
jgi:hypothetical protein